MNHDVAEVNGPDPLMLPGSFLYEKEPGYKAKGYSFLSFFTSFLPILTTGDALLTVATGSISDVQAEREGLVATCVYAVLNVVDIKVNSEVSIHVCCRTSDIVIGHSYSVM